MGFSTSILVAAAALFWILSANLGPGLSPGAALAWSIKIPEVLENENRFKGDDGEMHKYCEIWEYDHGRDLAHRKHDRHQRRPKPEREEDEELETKDETDTDVIIYTVLLLVIVAPYAYYVMKHVFCTHTPTTKIEPRKKSGRRKSTSAGIAILAGCGRGGMQDQIVQIDIAKRKRTTLKDILEQSKKKKRKGAKGKKKGKTEAGDKRGEGKSAKKAGAGAPKAKTRLVLTVKQV